MANKVEKVMREYKHGELHSGSKHGPKVKSRSQALAIALNEKREEGKKSATRKGYEKYVAHSKKTGRPHFGIHGEWTPAKQMAKEYDQGLRGGLTPPK